MLNIDIFLKRLEELMQANELNAAAFAERIGIQRSSMSHILTKRNKPSLDIILKINEAFEEVSLDWLLLDKETPYTPTPDVFSNALESNDKMEPIQDQINTTKHEDVVQIIQVFQDGSFRVLLPKT
ncbi:MAG: helix-turn-helix domain-containing protein [Flavobacteriaceae bacterium]